MNCYVCTVRGAAVPAVASCQSCGAGLCLEHLRESALERPAGGTVFACSHDAWSESAARVDLAARREAVAVAAPGWTSPREPAGSRR